MLLWGGLVLYYVVLGAIYWAVDGDPAGATLLLMATALGGLVAGWIWDWRRHHAHPRAEDQVDADASRCHRCRRRVPVGQHPPAGPRRRRDRRSCSEW